MNLYDIFKFGQYKGLTLKEVYQGTINLNKDLVKEYLIYTAASELEILNSVITVVDVTSLFTGNSKISTPEPVNMKQKDMRGYKNKEHLVEIMNFEIEDTYLKAVAIHSNIVQKDWVESIEKLFSNKDNLSPQYMSLKNFNIQIYSSSKEKIEIAEGDPQYIEWCIKNIERFYVDIEDMIELQELDVYKFIGIEVSPRDFPEGVYDYKHKMKNLKSSFFKKILDINEKKVKNYDIEVDKDRNREGSNLTNYGSSHEKYNGYNGWSDDVIDDAFEGDPENTWNVD